MTRVILKKGHVTLCFLPHLSGQLVSGLCREGAAHNDEIHSSWPLNLTAFAIGNRIFTYYRIEVLSSKHLLLIIREILFI